MIAKLSQLYWVKGLISRYFIRASFIFLALVTVLSMASPVQADASDYRVKRVKAAVVFNIAKFVTWPNDVMVSRPHKLMICFYKNNFLGRSFSTIKGKKIQGRRIAKLVVSTVSASDGCDVLFVNSQHLADFTMNVEDLPRSVLVVADLTDSQNNNDFASGIMINLVRQGSSMAFDVDLQQVKKQGLAISSELLKLARKVRTERLP